MDMMCAWSPYYFLSPVYSVGSWIAHARIRPWVIDFIGKNLKDIGLPETTSKKCLITGLQVSRR